jgi:hypothetical protein
LTLNPAVADSIRHILPDRRGKLSWTRRLPGRLIIESLVNTSDATLQRRRAYVPSLIEPAALRGGGFFLGKKLGDRTPAGRRPLGCQASLAICWPLKRQRAPRFRSACAKPQPDDRYCHNYRTLGSPRLWLNSTPPRVPITWEANASAAGPALGASPPLPDVGPHSENVIAGVSAAGRSSVAS